MFSVKEKKLYILSSKKWLDREKMGLTMKKHLSPPFFFIHRKKNKRHKREKKKTENGERRKISGIKH